MKFLAQLFTTHASKPASKYVGFSEFFRNASTEEKIKVFTEVAHKANKEQRAMLARSTGKSQTI